MIGLVPDPRAGRRRDDLADAEPMLEALARSRPAAILQSEAPRSAGPCSDLSWPRIVAPDAKNLCCVWPKFRRRDRRARCEHDSGRRPTGRRGVREARVPFANVAGEARSALELKDVTFEAHQVPCG